MDNELLDTALWDHCKALLERGLSYDDYARQMLYLLFLKIEDEQSNPPFNRPSIIPDGYDWNSLREKEGQELLLHYRLVLEVLGQQEGLAGIIFDQASCKIQDAEYLEILIDLINRRTCYTS